MHGSSHIASPEQEGIIIIYKYIICTVVLLVTPVLPYISIEMILVPLSLSYSPTIYITMRM